ncbi:MAG: AAA family ATPase [Candidatus Competibacteraceae bacterium]
MIESIHIENFKSLRDVNLQLGALNLFIGANASGKSNFFDAFRVLQGIGYGFTISEILDGRPKGSGSFEWDAIRGGSAKALFEGNSNRQSRLTLTAKTGLGKNRRFFKYGIGFSPITGKVFEEWLTSPIPIYDSRPIQQPSTNPFFQVQYYPEKPGRRPHLKFESSRPVLGQFVKGYPGRWNKSDAERAEQLQMLLADMQRLDPSPALLRGYSQAHQIQRMGERGENFAALVRTLCADPALKDAYLSWLRHLRPEEIDDVDTLRGAVGEPLFMLKEGGREFPAPVLSDGTLRFAAITAAFFQPSMPAILTIEEIENGIHASRLRLLVELLRNRASQGQTQIMATTHSPIVLAWLNEDEYATTFFCKRDEKTGESLICPLTELPHFQEVVRRQPIGDLFAEGWMEAAL